MSQLTELQAFQSQSARYSYKVDALHEKAEESPQVLDREVATRQKQNVEATKPSYKSGWSLDITKLTA